MHKRSSNGSSESSVSVTDVQQPERAWCNATTTRRRTIATTTLAARAPWHHTPSLHGDGRWDIHGIEAEHASLTSGRVSNNTIVKKHLESTPALDVAATHVS